MPVRPLALRLVTGAVALSALALAGCAGAPASPATVADACADVRTELTLMSSLLDAGLAGVADPSDGDAEDAYAAELETSADALGDAVAQREVAAAYASVKSAIEALAEAVAGAEDSAASAAVLQEKTDAVDATGAALMTLCAAPGDGGLDTAAASSDGAAGAGGAPSIRRAELSGIRPGEVVADITPSIQPDSGTREISLRRTDVASSVPGFVTLETNTASVFDPLTWGRDWKVSFRTNGISETWFTFTDESGDSYGMLKIRPFATHTVYFNSERPAIMRVTGS